MLFVSVNIIIKSAVKHDGCWKVLYVYVCLVEKFVVELLVFTVTCDGAGDWNRSFANVWRCHVLVGSVTIYVLQKLFILSIEHWKQSAVIVLLLSRPMICPQGEIISYAAISAVNPEFFACLATVCGWILTKWIFHVTAQGTFVQLRILTFVFRYL